MEARLPLLLAVNFAKQTEKTPLTGAISLWISLSTLIAARCCLTDGFK